MPSCNFFYLMLLGLKVDCLKLEGISEESIPNSQDADIKSQIGLYNEGCQVVCKSVSGALRSEVLISIH